MKSAVAVPAAGSVGGRDGMTRQLDYQNQYVSFRVASQLLGVPVNVVQEVLNPQTIAATPLARREIAGLLNLRGQIVTAVSLRRRLGLPDLPPDQRSMNVVVQHRGESYSLLVDDVGDVINIASHLLEPAPRTVSQQWKQVSTGIFRLEKGLFVVLDVAQLLTLN